MKKLIIVIFLCGLFQTGICKAPPQRIISLAPNISETVFKLGAGNLLIGRTEFCLYPEAVRSVPSVGGYLNPDYETMVSLQPDLILMFPNADMERNLRRFGLEVFTVPNDRLEDIIEGIKSLGSVLGRSERAATVAAGIQDTLDWVREHRPAGPPVEAMLVVGREGGSLNGIYVAGTDTYLSEILALCGGTNAFAGITAAKYFDVSTEALVERDPQAILEFRIMEPPVAPATLVSLLADWASLGVLQAPGKQAVFLLTDRYFLIPGPRVSRVAMELHRILAQVAQ